MLTGKVHTRDIAVSPLELDAFHAGQVSVQEFFPYLTDDEREFLVSGITPEEWASLPGEADDGHTGG
jgi:hypothetical protein